MKKITLLAACFAFSSVTFAQEMLTTSNQGTNPEVVTPREDCSQTINSNEIENGGFFGGDSNQRLAIDIDVADDTEFTLETIYLNLTDDGTSIDIIFYDDAGVPGTEIASITNATISDQIPVGSNFGFDWDQYVIDVSGESIVLEGGAKYWMEVVSDATAWESTTEEILGLNGAFLNDGTSGAWTVGTGEYVYTLEGDCATLSVNDELLSQVSVYPNPATSVINVNVPSGVQIESTTLVDVLGKNTGATISNGTINVSELAKGIYILSVETTAGTLTQKVVKK